MHSAVAVWLYLSSLWVYSLTEAICNQKSFIWRGKACLTEQPKKKSDVKAKYGNLYSEFVLIQVKCIDNFNSFKQYMFRFWAVHFFLVCTEHFCIFMASE